MTMSVIVAERPGGAGQARRAPRTWKTGPLPAPFTRLQVRLAFRVCCDFDSTTIA
jgi:hypothetical protein